MLDSIYHMTNTLKSDFWRKNVIILSVCMLRCYGRHNVSRKAINHKWFIDFIAWRYFTLRRARRHMIIYSKMFFHRLPATRCTMHFTFKVTR